MEIYRSSSASIVYDEEHNCILQTIHNFLNSEELKRFQTRLIRFCDNKNASKIIADTTNLKAVRSDDMSWLSTEVLPALSNCGVRHFAIVMPENPFGEMAVRMFIEAASEIHMKVFNDLSLARQWIHGFD